MDAKLLKRMENGTKLVDENGKLWIVTWRNDIVVRLQQDDVTWIRTEDPDVGGAFEDDTVIMRFQKQEDIGKDTFDALFILYISLPKYETIARGKIVHDLQLREPMNRSCLDFTSIIWKFSS